MIDAIETLVGVGRGVLVGVGEWRCVGVVVGNGVAVGEKVGRGVRVWVAVGAREGVDVGVEGWREAVYVGEGDGIETATGIDLVAVETKARVGGVVGMAGFPPGVGRERRNAAAERRTMKIRMPARTAGVCKTDGRGPMCCWASSSKA